MSQKKPPAVGEQIVKARRRLDISGNGLAKKTGISQSHIHKIEHGGGATLESLQQIADVLQVSITIHPQPPMLTRG